MSIVNRAKDTIQRSVQNYVKATTTDYAKYFDGSQSYIIYYQLDDLASTMDQVLESVHSLTGNSSPKKYRKINDVVVYGVNELDILNQLSERGLESEIAGEFVFLPDSIKPKPGDFFVFDYEGMTDHLFIINDVQYDKASPEKFYKVSFSLYKHNADEIFGNLEGEYQMIFDNIGGELTTVVSSEAASLIEDGKAALDSAIETYKTLFYDDDSDSFIAKIGTKSIWSSYLQHFLSKSKALSSYSKEILTEIYIGDITESEFPNYYSEIAYRNSLFRIIETKQKAIPVSCDFLNLGTKNLKETRNLPFFQSNLDFLSLSPIEYITDTESSLKEFPNFIDSFSFLWGNPAIPFKEIDHYHKFHIMDEVHTLARDKEWNDSGKENPVKDGDVVYECFRNEIEPTGIYRVTDEIQSDGTVNRLYKDISLNALLNNNENLEGHFFLNIVLKYLRGTLELTEEIIEYFRDGYFENSIENYIMIPLAIYALKETIKTTN